MRISVFAGVGERTREGNDLLREMIESGIVNTVKSLVIDGRRRMGPLAKVE